MRFLSSLVVGMGVGMSCVFVASALAGFPRAPEGQFRLIEGAWKYAGHLMALSLALMGFIVGLTVRVHPIVFGVATLIMMPVLAFVDMFINPYTHTLWPLEFALYGAFMAIPIGAAYLGRWIRLITGKVGQPRQTSPFW